MRMQQNDVIRIPMAGPGDTTGLIALLDSGRVRAQDIVAILAKTEGNGCVNDFTREYTTLVFANTLGPYLNLAPSAVKARIALIMSGGTEGVLSPHATVFSRHVVESQSAGNANGSKRLAIGIAFTRKFLPEELGRNPQIEETARAVLAGMHEAEIASVDDVHFVQIKCPLLTSERIADARLRGKTTATDDTYVSMAYSRGASALGVAQAMAEVNIPIRDADVLSNWELYSSVASVSAGIEVDCNVVIVMGNSEAAAGDLVIGHSVMEDAIDAQGIHRAFAGVGMDIDSGESPGERIINIFAKAEASPHGRLRGFRHTMLDDSDINSTRHARAAVGGLVAGLAGNPAVYVSGGAEHQGPAGGGPVAVIASAA